MAGAILIAGPTASGKSALALRLARRHGGVVVNADSMQVYEGLRILSARPSEREMEGVEHRLYGHASPAEPYSAGAWMRDAQAVLTELGRRGLVPVICGGTGLYFRSLLGGLGELPPVPAEIRERWRARLASEGLAALHALLRRRDPEAAARIRPSDPQRTLRALELGEASGRTMADLWSAGGRSLVEEAGALRLVLAPPRPVLRERIDLRFRRMVEEGAIEEARAFRDRFGAGEGLAAQAIGLRELLRYADGETSLDTAIEEAVTRSRQYAKRQETWFRNQFDAGWTRLENADDFEA